jgi:hypothetical protein
MLTIVLYQNKNKMSIKKIKYAMLKMLLLLLDKEQFQLVNTQNDVYKFTYKRKKSFPIGEVGEFKAQTILNRKLY